MKLTIYQVDAFAEKVFEGNPAAVCPLKQWLPESTMQAIAAENNLSETAFFVPEDDGFHIRWFTPNGEVNLCGHATLASAFVLFNSLSYQKDIIEFKSKSGILKVTKNGDAFNMDFPLQPPVACEVPEPIRLAFSQPIRECLKSEDYIVVFNNEADVAAAEPNLELLLDLDLRGVIITSPSSTYDFVARFFVPKYGIPEDPVTGSAYTQLAPYWSEQQGKNEFHVKQISKRGGELLCEVQGDRVLISGSAVAFMEGKIKIEV